MGTTAKSALREIRYGITEWLSELDSGPFKLLNRLASQMGTTDVYQTAITSSPVKIRLAIAADQ
jgi:hypothetical protein